MTFNVKDYVMLHNQYVEQELEHLGIIFSKQLVVQNNLFNVSQLNTVVACSLTSYLKRASAPGNVLLPKGEANLQKKSVVSISQIYTVNKPDLVEKIGKVSEMKFQEILSS